MAGTGHLCQGSRFYCGKVLTRIGVHAGDFRHRVVFRIHLAHARTHQQISRQYVLGLGNEFQFQPGHRGTTAPGQRPLAVAIDLHRRDVMGVGNQQHPTGERQHLVHLTHQTFGIQYRLSAEHPVPRTFVNQHPFGIRVRRDVDNFRRHHLAVDDLSGMIQFQQAAVLTDKTLQQLQFLLRHQQFLPQAIIFLQQAGAGNKDIVDPDRDLGGYVGYPVDRRGDVAQAIADFFKIAEAMVREHDAD